MELHLELNKVAAAIGRYVSNHGTELPNIRSQRALQCLKLDYTSQ